MDLRTSAKLNSQTILSFTLPKGSAIALPGQCYCQYDSLNPKKDLDSVLVYGVRQSRVWFILPLNWMQCHTKKDSNSVFEMYWGAIKQDADMHYIRGKNERNREGLPDTMLIDKSDWIMLLTRCRDITGNYGCYNSVSCPR